jgi:CheY-like chemotaxis protein/anti-sigma regulatory factor (Ser/Thr protein kinase)
VDDALVDRRKAGGLVEEGLGWHVLYADNGRAALAAIAQHSPAVVLTDLQMPEMSGLELVEAIRRRYPLLPVVLMTAHGSEEIAVEALRKGASSYVSKRRLTRDLAETLEQVLATARADQHHQRLVQCLRQWESYFVLENDPALIRALVALVQRNLADMNLGDEGRRMRGSIALEEALTNALYHGNLEVSSELRQQGSGDAYLRAAEERRHEPPYRDRCIHVQVRLSCAESVYVIRDEGNGFDPAALPDPTDPANMEKASGRGLLLIRTFMDRVTFNEVGNEITMVMCHQPTDEKRLG